MHQFERYRQLTPERRQLVAERLAKEHTKRGVPLPGSPLLAASGAPTETRLGFSLFFFSDPGRRDEPLYSLLLACARIADVGGLEAIWVPERHFHSFGGPYPNPSVLAAALAVTTSRIGIRAGSVVLPLHRPVRLVEEWSMVDNLSNGRVAMAIASGWHPIDFAMLSDIAHAKRKTATELMVDAVQFMWITGHASAPNVEPAAVEIFPHPVQPVLPLWLTTASGKATWRFAAHRGLGVLTGLMDQGVDQLGANIALYQSSRHGADSGKVTLMLHTLLGECADVAQANAAAALEPYLLNHLSMYEAFVREIDPSIDPASLTASDRRALVRKGIGRYLDGQALIGSPTSVRPICERLIALGVNEIACLIDFGAPRALVEETVYRICDLAKTYQTGLSAHLSSGAGSEGSKEAVNR